MTKNVSLIASAAALILLGLLQFAADAYIGGELSWTAIWNEIKAPFSVMRDSLLSSAEAMEKSGGQIYGVSVGELTAAFRQMKASMLRVLPSIVIVTALFIGWLAHGIFGGCIRFLAPPQLDKRGKVTMSLTAAVIFTLSYLAALVELRGCKETDAAAENAVREPSYEQRRHYDYRRQHAEHRGLHLPKCRGKLADRYAVYLPAALFHCFGAAQQTVAHYGKGSLESHSHYRRPRRLLRPMYASAANCSRPSGLCLSRCGAMSETFFVMLPLARWQ